MNSAAVASVYNAVAIILVNWNGWSDTIECLDSILCQKGVDFKIFVVDNASRDGSIEKIAAWCDQPTASDHWVRHASIHRWTSDPVPARIPYRVLADSADGVGGGPGDHPVTLIRSGTNLGFAGGCNVAVRVAGLSHFRFFWFLNNDTVLMEDALGALVRRATETSRPGMTGSTVKFYAKPDVIQVRAGARMNFRRGTASHIGEGDLDDPEAVDHESVERKMDYVMGASMLVSNEFIRKVGMMREDYFLYFEEIDWALRGRGRFALGYAPGSRVLHKAQASGGKAVRFSTRYFYRNRIRFVSRFFPQYLSSTRIGLVVEMLRHLAKGRWTHVQLIAATLVDSRKLAAETVE